MNTSIFQGANSSQMKNIRDLTEKSIQREFSRVVYPVYNKVADLVEYIQFIGDEEVCRLGAVIGDSYVVNFEKSVLNESAKNEIKEMVMNVYKLFVTIAMTNKAYDAISMYDAFESRIALTVAGVLLYMQEVAIHFNYDVIEKIIGKRGTDAVDYKENVELKRKRKLVNDKVRKINRKIAPSVRRLQKVATDIILAFTLNQGDRLAYLKQLDGKQRVTKGEFRTSSKPVYKREFRNNVLKPNEVADSVSNLKSLRDKYNQLFAKGALDPSLYKMQLFSVIEKNSFASDIDVFSSEAYQAAVQSLTKNTLDPLIVKFKDIVDLNSNTINSERDVEMHLTFPFAGSSESMQEAYQRDTQAIADLFSSEEFTQNRVLDSLSCHVALRIALIATMKIVEKRNEPAAEAGVIDSIVKRLNLIEYAVQISGDELLKASFVHMKKGLIPTMYYTDVFIR